MVRNDTFALLRAGASGPWGVAVVCGAGINAVGVAPSGAVARLPALGRLSGDWGGGQDLGEEALWHAVRAEDGRGRPTALARLVTSHFGTATVEELVLAVHFGLVDGDRLHELAPGVLAAAGDGDPVARELVERQAEEVTVLAEVCLRRLGLLETPVEVVLGGGLLTARDPLMTKLLEAGFALRAPHAEPVVADRPPVMGGGAAGPGTAGRRQGGLDGAVHGLRSSLRRSGGRGTLLSSHDGAAAPGEALWPGVALVLRPAVALWPVRRPRRPSGARPRRRGARCS
ncbi:N-acetylglucosamine kinase [Nonomuraea salmonea]|uniref:N-acetylglucosamine kinase n=1 Tax=Nonomuraea salmonea TaxID=46181 RepID=UPI003CD09689